MTSTAVMPKSQRVYQHLYEQILSGAFGPGYRIVLDKIARELKVSPVPVREAVRRLEAEGLVVFTPNVGAEVAGVNAADYRDAMETLALLEGAATSLAAPHLSPEQFAEATAINDEMRTLNRGDFDPVHFTELNERFHRVLCSACPNEHLLELMSREWQRLSMIRRSSFNRIPMRPATSVAEHEALLALVAEQAPAEEIEMAAREHKMRTLTEFLDSGAGAD